MSTLKIRKIGNSLGVILPKDVLELLDVEEGDTLSFARSAHGVMVSVDDADADHLLPDQDK